MSTEFLNIWKRVRTSLGISSFPVEPADLNGTFSQEISSKEKFIDFDGCDQVRILLLRERCGQGRRLLFDSKAVKKKNIASNDSETVKEAVKDNSIEKSFKLNVAAETGYTYEVPKPNSDGEMLREMIFGSVSISYNGITMKVHTMRASQQIMISALFPVLPPPVGEVDIDESYSSPSSKERIISKSSELSVAHSVPLDVPARKHSDDDSFCFEGSDSALSENFYTSLPLYGQLASKNSPSLPRSGSYNNLQRRLLRNKATSMEFGIQKSSQDLRPPKAMPEELRKIFGPQEKTKLALSVIISLKGTEDEQRQFQDFLFTHVSLIERHVLELKNKVIEAYMNRQRFFPVMHEASRKLQFAIEDLFSTPRLQSPSWLTVITSPKHHDASMAFLKNFASILKVYDTKNMNFFASTLLTAVLAHHLSWVPTVIPSEAEVTYSQHALKHTPAWVDTLTQSRPYNPLWVQLGDLYGALSLPYRITKTVVVGSNVDVIMEFLNVLSYFIRCSDIVERVGEKPEKYEEEIIKMKGNDMKTLEPNSFNSDNCRNMNSYMTQLSNNNNTASVNKNFFTSSASKNLTCLTTPCDAMHNNLREDVCLVLEEEDDNDDSLGYASLEPELGNSRLNSFDNTLIDHDLACTCSECCCKKDINTSKVVKEKVQTKANEHFSDVCDNKQCDKSCEGRKEILNYILSVSNNIPNREGENHKDNSILSCDSLQDDDSEEGYCSIDEKPKTKSTKYSYLSKLIEDYDNWSPECLYKVPIPQLKSTFQASNSYSFKSFGWSLIAGLSDHYLADFCLQGVVGKIDEREIRQDLIKSTQVNILGDTIKEAVCIVADIDNCTVHLLSSERNQGDKLGSAAYHIGMSSIVSSTCDSILELIDSGFPTETCMIHLEDKLQEIYFQSLTLAELLSSNVRFKSIEQVASQLDCNTSDIPLLLTIATVHTPCLSVFNQWCW